MSPAALDALARDVFGYDHLSPEQHDAITAVLEGHDVLAVVPTGAGKSAIYQLAALRVDGPTVVVSPLLALQRDQLEHLDESSAPVAVSVNSAQSAPEQRAAWDGVDGGRESLDAYYQQIGRAGRDGEPAGTALFHRPQDLHLQRFLTAGRAPKAVLRAVATALRDAAEPLAPSRVPVEARPAARTRAVNLLEQAGAVLTDARGRLVWADAERAVKDAVAAAAEVFDTHQQLIRSRLEMMRGYADTTGCRRQFLLGYLGEQRAEPCGNCDRCSAGIAAFTAPAGDVPFPPDTTVGHAEWGHGTVMSVDADTLTVLFDEAGYRTLSVTAVTEHDLLQAS